MFSRDELKAWIRRMDEWRNDEHGGYCHLIELMGDLETEMEARVKQSCQCPADAGEDCPLTAEECSLRP